MNISEKQEERILKTWSRTVRLLGQRWMVDEFEPSYHILSFGGGRQTWALLLKMKELFANNKKAFVIFADTGGEHQTTYDYINEHVVPFCKLHNIQFIRVYSKYDKTLYEYCWDKKIVPSIKFRDCTSKFKIAPIRKFIRAKLKVTRSHPCYVYIGISYDESTRMNVSNVKYAISVFPLVDGYKEYCPPELTVADCKKIVIDAGYPEVPKSGCWFCPFMNVTDLLDPQYREQIIKLEENNSRFPEILLRGVSKSKVKPIRETTKSDAANASCKSGYCMV